MTKSSPTRGVVGRYALYGVLAQGGMATVHIGRLRGEVGFSRTVAIKRLHPQFASDPDFVAGFLDEARLAARVRHPNAISVIDVVATKGEVLLVMEYVQGETLSCLIRNANRAGQKIPPRIVAAIVCNVLDGLHAAHEARDEQGVPLGIVHRDVSPQNVLVGVDGVARVLDFGIAKATGRSRVTQEGQLKGKLAYMAPEQLHGHTSRRSDVYAAGVVLWEALVGERLYAGSNEGETVTRILTNAARPPSEKGSPREYDEVVMKALSFSPDDRFATAREMTMALALVGSRAEPHEVGAWLEGVAKEQLATHAEIVSSIESAPLAFRLDDIGAAATPASIPDGTASNASLTSEPAREGRRAITLATLIGLVTIVLAGGVALRLGHSPRANGAARQPRSLATAEPTASVTPPLPPDGPGAADAGVVAAASASGRPSAAPPPSADHNPMPRLTSRPQAVHHREVTDGAGTKVGRGAPASSLVPDHL